MRQCWSAVSTTYNMWGGLGLKAGFSNFTVLSQKAIILLTLPLCTVALLSCFALSSPSPSLWMFFLVSIYAFSGQMSS